MSTYYLTDQTVYSSNPVVLLYLLEDSLYPHTLPLNASCKHHSTFNLLETIFFLFISLNWIFFPLNGRRRQKCSLICYYNLWFQTHSHLATAENESPAFRLSGLYKLRTQEAHNCVAEKSLNNAHILEIPLILSSNSTSILNSLQEKENPL